ncbi:high-affinity nickel/cobalt transporter protein (plasmid) [Rhizobium etli]|uniref:Nickel/cobalt efflux system n=1 Tax=Rhizobium etli TaxID=29449 RepID=A0AAN1EN22_RHIET|nr:high-affinity nickel/cobalt transporter protein [Rhizobium sp. NXC14]ARQ13437.1 high-affinity nickel/cobalt transporter protein [Rhizobium etli]
MLAHVFRGTFKVVTQSWHMYPIGFLFGLGFDTATEIALLGISVSQTVQDLSFWTILVFPILFTAGMSLMDTTDSALMTGAYGWALMNPVRKLWYNLTITAVSGIVAMFIGGLEAFALISELKLQGSFWEAAAKLNDNLENLGVIVVGIFVASWFFSRMIYRMKGYDRIHRVRPKTRGLKTISRVQSVQCGKQIACHRARDLLSRCYGGAVLALSLTPKPAVAVRGRFPLGELDRN